MIPLPRVDEQQVTINHKPRAIDERSIYDYTTTHKPSSLKVEESHKRMIWTITLNPAIDYAYHVNTLKTREPVIADRVMITPAGKGINVSRAIASLGRSSIAVLLASTDVETLYQTALVRQSIIPRILTTLSCSRHHLTLSSEDGDLIHIREHGGGSIVYWRDVARAIQEASPGDSVALSGSLPKGADPGIYAQIVSNLRHQEAFAWVDTSGVPLETAIAAKPYGVKINAVEASRLLLRRVESERDAAESVRTLLAHGIEFAAITLGSKGIVAGKGEEVVHALCSITVSSKHINAVGSGDSALAALMIAADDNLDLPTATRLAAACGAANLRNDIPGAFSKLQVEECLEVTTFSLL